MFSFGQISKFKRSATPRKTKLIKKFLRICTSTYYVLHIYKLSRDSVELFQRSCAISLKSDLYLRYRIKPLDMRQKSGFTQIEELRFLSSKRGTTPKKNINQYFLSLGKPRPICTSSPCSLRNLSRVTKCISCEYSQQHIMYFLTIKFSRNFLVL